MEGIVVSIRKHGRAFAIHEQPEDWFRPRMARVAS